MKFFTPWFVSLHTGTIRMVKAHLGSVFQGLLVGGWEEMRIWKWEVQRVEVTLHVICVCVFDFCCQQCLKAEAYPKITQGLPVGFNWIHKWKNQTFEAWDLIFTDWALNRLLNSLWKKNVQYDGATKGGRTALGSQTPETLAVTSHLEHHLSGRCWWFLGLKACWSYTLVEVLHVSI